MRWCALIIVSSFYSWLQGLYARRTHGRRVPETSSARQPARHGGTIRVILSLKNLKLRSMLFGVFQPYLATELQLLLSLFSSETNGIISVARWAVWNTKKLNRNSANGWWKNFSKVQWSPRKVTDELNIRNFTFLINNRIKDALISFNGAYCRRLTRVNRGWGVWGMLFNKCILLYHPAQWRLIRDNS